MPTPKTGGPPLTPRPSRTVQAGDPPNSQYTPSKASTRAGNAPQTHVRQKLGVINTDDMFLQDVELFLKDYAPREVSSKEIDKCIERLKKGRSPIIQTQDGGKLNWKVFPMFPDKYEGEAGHENEVFKPLKTIFDAILKQKRRSNKIHFELCPRTKIDGDLPGGNHLIDGCFMSEKYDPNTGHLCHRDLDVVMELKKFRNKVNRDQSHRQMLGATHHILSEDPRRMWIYGITVEKNMMTVWYFSRSHSVKTFAFDWLENVKIVVQIILSFALAAPAELGIDPLVHKGPPARDGKTWSYVYEVPGSATGGLSRFYKTEQGRSPERPMCIAGRVTRIWDVVEVEGPDGETEICHEKCILKDVWLDVNTQTEAENMDKIFKSVDDFVTAGLEAGFEEALKQNPDLERDSVTMDRLLTKFINEEKRFKHFNNVTKDRLRGYLTDKKYRSLFLTKRHAWRGQVSKELGKDVLHCPTLFTSDSIEAIQTGSQSAASESHYRDSYQAPEIEIITRQPEEPEARKDMLSSRRFVAKQQSRFVYDEVCTRIDRLPTFGDVVDVLCGAVDALHVLFLAGWVHRDISVGNILAIPATPGCDCAWSVKLSDLEFSQVMLDKKRVPRSDPRTGTPFFMPIEILRRRYRFQDYRLDVSDVNNVESKVEESTSALLELRDDTTLADQVKVVTQLDYPHLKAFPFLPFKIERMLEATNLDPLKIPSESAVVNHNFQHDLESIWWILMWFITHGFQNQKPSDWAAALFQHNVKNYQDRFIAFDNPVTLHLRDLPEVLKGSFLARIEYLRISMDRYYILRPIYGQLDDPESYSMIHALFAEQFYTFKLDRLAQWRNLALEHSNTLGVIKIPGSGAAPKRVRTRSVSRVSGSSKKPRSRY